MARRLKEPKYISIYCAATAKRAEKHTHHHREQLGRCFAEKVGGRWQCCCCGKPVSVVW